MLNGWWYRVKSLVWLGVWALIKRPRGTEHSLGKDVRAPHRTSVSLAMEGLHSSGIACCGWSSVELAAAAEVLVLLC